MKEVFAIRDITSDILIPDDDRPVELVNDGWRPISFDTYPEAKNHIETLEKGYYQIDKIFINYEEEKQIKT